MNKADKIYKAKVQLERESTMSVSKRQWWKPHRKKLMTSLTNYSKANTLTTWLRNNFYKLPIRLEYQYSAHLQKSTNLTRLVDPSPRFWRLYRTNILTFGYIAPAYRTETIKDTTDFISFIEQTKIGKDTILVSMDVSSLYRNIPQEEGTEIACKAYDSFHNYNPPIPTRFLREMLGLILNENLFQFNWENYLKTHGTATGTIKWQYHLPIFSCLKLKQ